MTTYSIAVAYVDSIRDIIFLEYLMISKKDEYGEFGRSAQ